VAVSLSIALSIATSAHAIDLTGGTCKPRDAIEASERDPFENAALRFVSQIARDDVAEAETELTSELRNYVPFERLKVGIQPNLATFQSLHSLRVSYSYLVQTAFMTGKSQTVICAVDANASTNSIDGKVFVSARPFPKQAHVIIEGTAANGIWTFSLWMVPEQDSWHVEGFHIAPPSSLGMTTTQLWDLAREQRQMGHNLNAAVAYAAASQIVYRGPNFQLGIWSELQSEAAALKLPSEIQGQPPFMWRLDDSVFRVLSVAPAVDDSQLALGIRYQADSGADRKQIEDQSHLLIRELRKVHPEYLDGFEAVVVDAEGPEGQPIHSVEKVR
jgi:hypothetical protein